MTIGDLLESVFSFISKNEDVRHVLQKPYMAAEALRVRKVMVPTLIPFWQACSAFFLPRLFGRAKRKITMTPGLGV